MRIAYFDCFSGASGDMILGALVDAGWNGLEAALRQLKVPGWKLEARRVSKQGLSATKVDFHLDAAGEERHLGDMLRVIDHSSLDQAVKAPAGAIFRRLAEVEAAIHDCSVEEVHFHELGGLDTLLDVVGACAGFAHFGFQQVHLSPVAVGSGSVQTMHGWLPVPAPATAKLLEGWSVVDGGVAKELTTPTGAAILTHFGTAIGMPPLKLERVAYGAGARDLERPNVLRLMVGQPEEEPGAEAVVVIETMIDDMSPELIPVVLEELLAASARDAFVTAVQGKKGRPAWLLTALAAPGQEDSLIDILFRETSTIGVRFRTERRRVLARRELTVETAYGVVRVKVSGEGAHRKSK
ncbi:MAG: nickel pincer cofactor biosynthesis protein LarC, partial [Chloroflexota bacterium]|nr:nickel pincer cofactor biosynthesis protein LarC [Chloroflexota bacterium]